MLYCLIYPNLPGQEYLLGFSQYYKIEPKDPIDCEMFLLSNYEGELIKYSIGYICHSFSELNEGY